MADDGFDETGQKLKQFKKNVADIHNKDYDDYYYLRWLQARDFDLDKAATMLRDHLKWRKEFGLDELMKTYKPSELLMKYIPLHFPGYAKDGSMVAVFYYGMCDMKGLLNSTTPEEMDKFIFYQFEKHIQEMRRRNKMMGLGPEYKMFYICDLTNLPLTDLFRSAVRNYLTSLSTKFDCNYPEIFRKGVFINGSKIFSIVWSVFRPFLHENTANKFDFYGGEDWKQRLLHDVPEDVLPSGMGGNNDTVSMSTSGGEIPHCFHTNNLE